MNMKVYWCQCGPRHGNFGDRLTPLLLDYFGIPHQWSPPDRAEVVGIGSILEGVPETFSGTIWTSGAISPAPEPRRFAAARTLAVRGKLTASQLGERANQEIVLGDGGLLVALFRRATAKRYKIGLVPHYAQADDPQVKALARHPEVRLIDACAPPREVIDAIGRCETILSSSLHGLIIADALEIPNRWVQFPATSERVVGGSFKFLDYYSVFGIDDLLPARLSSQETLDSLLPLFDGYDRPGLEQRVDALLKSFERAFERRSASQRTVPPLRQTGIPRIRDREAELLRRLAIDATGGGRACLWASEAVERPDAVTAALPAPEMRTIEISLDAAKSQLGDAASSLVELFRGCLAILRRMHEHGVCHGDIRRGNLLVRGSTPGLLHFGWRPPIDSSQASGEASLAELKAEWQTRDVQAMGKVLEGLCEKEPSLHALAQRMAHPDASLAIRDLAFLECCVDAIASRLGWSSQDCSTSPSGNSSDAAPAEPLTANVVAGLLDRLAQQDRQIHDLRRENEAAEARLRDLEHELIAAELSEHVPPPNRFLIADGEQWRAELDCGERAIPFPEKDGMYWGLPADDAHAVGELERLRSQDVAFFVLTEPMAWWREAYPGFFAHLDARFECSHQSTRMTIFRMVCPKRMASELK